MEKAKPRLRQLAALSIAIISLVLAPGLTRTGLAADVYHWGALCYDPANKTVIGRSVRQNSRKAAIRAVKAAGGSGCTKFRAFLNICAAVYVDKHGHGAWAVNKKPAKAQLLAAKMCTRYYKKCKLRAVLCSGG